MIRKSFFALLVLCLTFISVSGQEMPQTRPENVGMSTHRIERLTTLMQQYIDENQLIGSVVLIAREGEVPYQKSFGLLDRESNTPMPDNAIFRIASQSKAVVSVAVMILQEQGKLVITEPVGNYLPEYLNTTVAVPSEEGGYDVVEANRKITIRDLLTHTAGIGYGGGPAADQWEAAEIQGWYFAHRDEPIRETVRRMAALPMDAQPGERFVYGYNTDILGALVEVASGMPLDEFLKVHILDPLDMRDTHFYLPEEKVDRLATVYSYSDGEIVRSEDPGRMVGQGQYVNGPRKNFSAGAGLLSTARDYARFLQMLLNEGELNGVRVLAPSTVRQMLADHAGHIQKTPGQGLGLGFWLLEEPGLYPHPGGIGSFGWGGAYHSTYWVDPVEQLVVVYFTQLIPTGGVDDHAKLRTLVYQSIVDEARN